MQCYFSKLCRYLRCYNRHKHSLLGLSHFKFFKAKCSEIWDLAINTGLEILAFKKDNKTIFSLHPLPVGVVC